MSSIVFDGRPELLHENMTPTTKAPMITSGLVGIKQALEGLLIAAG
jgi:hypothetical protein